jgi:hypothetical protein
MRSAGVASETWVKKQWGRHDEFVAIPPAFDCIQHSQQC